MKEIKWVIRHFRKDGTELKKGDQFPITPENLEIARRMVNLANKTHKQEGTAD